MMMSTEMPMNDDHGELEHLDILVIFAENRCVSARRTKFAEIDSLDWTHPCNRTNQMK
jgi:hypothetical protein